MTREEDPLFLSVAEVLALHKDQLRLFGGSPGLRDVGALESAVATPMATYDDQFLHEDIFLMAAAYAFHIAENQAFVDGNKRTGLNAHARALRLKTNSDAETDAAQRSSVFAAA